MLEDPAPSSSTAASNKNAAYSTQGVKAKPFQIPLRACMAKDVDNTSFVQSGNKLLIRVQAISDNYKVDRIRIYSVDAEKGSVQLKDTLVGGVKRVDFYFMYTVPSYFISDTAALTLQFEAVASNGGSSKMALAYKVVGGASLIHYDGIVMYGARSGRANGFSLASAQTLYCETADSSTIDIYDYHDTLSGDTSGRLSREWRSRTGLQFARMNDFDYSGTNQLLLNNAFKASRRYSSLKDIAEGDVVLFGRADQALGVNLAQSTNSQNISDSLSTVCPT